MEQEEREGAQSFALVSKWIPDTLPEKDSELLKILLYVMGKKNVFLKSLQACIN